MSRNAWIIFGAMIVAIVGGLVLMSRQDKIDLTNVDVSKIQEASASSGNIADRVFGKKDSPVVFIEYADYQCSGCAASFETIKELSEKYKDKVAFVFRSFPIVSYHPNAMIAASSAEAAGLQNKFWEMHDRIFQDQDLWSNLSGSERLDYFVNAATDLGLDIDKFKHDLESESVSKKVNFDRNLGEKANVTATPSFYLNNKEISNLWYKDDKIVPKGTDGAAQVWSSVDALSKLVIEPALKEHGIE